MRSSKTSSSYLLYGGAVLVVLGLIVFAATQEKAPTIYDGFAQCLSDNGMVMYGAWWCSHCENQKEAFGDAFDSVNYVECSAPGSRSMNSVCEEAGIEGYPTWVDAEGNLLPGEKSMDQLAELSGCELPSESEE